MSKVIYLACPYSDKSKKVVSDRVLKATKLAAKLVSEGHVVLSPIVYGDILLKHEDMPNDYEFWKNFCESFLSKCDEIWIYMLPGWNQSTGVLAEIELAKKLGIKHNLIPYEGE